MKSDSQRCRSEEGVGSAFLKVGRIAGLTQNRNVTEANDALDWNDLTSYIAILQYYNIY
jgi:hypothetical protein